MRSFWADPYLWVHLAGLAAVPIFLELCLIGLAVDQPFLPAWVELLIVGAIGVAPILWMQWQRPFSIFSLVLLALKPEQLTADQRRILRLFKSPIERVLASLTTILLLIVLWQLYQLAPLAADIASGLPIGRGSGLLLAAIAFLLSNLFFQVPVSVVRVLLTPEAQFVTTEPYPVERITQDFTLLGLRVPRLLPSLIAAPPPSSAPAPTSPPPPTPIVPPSTAPDSLVVQPIVQPEPVAVEAEESAGEDENWDDDTALPDRPAAEQPIARPDVVTTEAVDGEDENWDDSADEVVQADLPAAEPAEQAAPELLIDAIEQSEAETEIEIIEVELIEVDYTEVSPDAESEAPIAADRQPDVEIVEIIEVELIEADNAEVSPVPESEGSIAADRQPDSETGETLSGDETSDRPYE